MAAPDTNIGIQKRRHRGLLIGIALGLLFGVSLVIYWLLEDAAPANGPQSGAPQTEGRETPGEDAGTGAPRTTPTKAESDG